MRRQILSIFLAAAACLASLHAKAGIPVIDVAAIANLIQQVMYWQQQISSMQKHYEQLKASKDQLVQTHDAMTGTRGMEQVLPISQLERNYLPASYDELIHTLDGSPSSYAGLTSQMQSIMKANSILSGMRMDALSPELRQIIQQGRQSSAMFNGMSRSAYEHTSQRFQALQELINRIATARDPKAIQDLQARIQAEQTMLTNEQTKLQSLYRMAQAEQAAQQQRLRERATADVGSVRSLPRVSY